MQEFRSLVKTQNDKSKSLKNLAQVLNNVRNIIEELQKGTAISKTAKEYGIIRQTVYRIKIDYESNQADS